jgi:beta-N-acetylhexosaminidase
MVFNSSSVKCISRLPGIFLVCAIFLTAFSCTTKTETATVRYEKSIRTQAIERKEEFKKITAQKNDALAAYFDSLSETQKLSQLFLVNLEGKEHFYPVEFDAEGNPAIPGGYLLFSYNIADTPEQTAAFTSSIKDFCAVHERAPPYLAIDHEGGTVNRVRQFIRLPSAREVASMYSPYEAEELYYAQGNFLKTLGVHLNLAPVVEAVTNENKNFLDDRSFGGIEKAISYSERALDGYRRAGIGTALKHFPGNTNDDPHTGLPLIRADKENFERDYVAPFRTLAKKSSCVLMSHACVAGYDEQTPACLSRYWVTTVLREDIGFEGLVISDDVYMAALEKNGYPPEKAVIDAIEAGVTVLMISEKRFIPALNALTKRAESDTGLKNQIDDAVRRVIAFKIERGILEYTGTFSHPDGIAAAGKQ